MYDYIVVGGGIESLLFCFFVLSKLKKVNIAFLIKSPSDMSKYSSLCKVGFRHVSTSEYINFLSQTHLRNLTRRHSLGGWKDINEHLNKYEMYWLKKRFQAGFSGEFISLLEKRLGGLALEGLSLWSEFLHNHPEFASDVDLNRGVYRISNYCKRGDELHRMELEAIKEGFVHSKEVFFEDNAFSFNSLKFCMKVSDFLRAKGVTFFYDTEISKLNFTATKRLKDITSSCGKTFVARNYFFAIGANFFGSGDYFNLRRLTQPVMGIWFLVRDVCIKHSFKYRHYVDSHLAFYQNYTPVFSSSDSFNPDYVVKDESNALLVGTGCMWVRYMRELSYSNNTFVKNHENILRRLFPSKHITLLDQSCIRNISYNCLPLIHSGESLNGRYFSISGTGTFTTAAAVHSASRATKFFLDSAC